MVAVSWPRGRAAARTSRSWCRPPRSRSCSPTNKPAKPSRERRTSAGAGAGRRGRDRARVAPDWSPVVPATLEDGTPVAMSELARCLCEADITRIVMAADGQPLDVGRTRRLHTPAQRKAVIARDRQCVWNGCETPAARCEVHHVLLVAPRQRSDRRGTRRPGVSTSPRRDPPPGPDHRTRPAPTRHRCCRAHALRVPQPRRHRGQRTTRLDRTPSSCVTAGRIEPGAALRATRPAGTGPPLAAPATCHCDAQRDARRVAREQASFARFDSYGPPPEWATQ